MTESSLEIRRRLVRLVETYPGLHLRELARQAGLSEALADYHLNALHDEKIIQGQEEGQFRRFHPTKAPAPGPEDQALIGVLRQPVPLQIALHLLEHGRSTQQDFVDVLGLAKSTVSYHASKLQEAGFLVPAEGGGLSLTDPGRVRRLLLRWRPPKSLTERFAALWSDFYEGSKR